jgi:hypothetical protein
MRTLGTRWLMMILWLMFMMGAIGDWGYRVEKFEESPGLYYIDKGTVNLYNTVWKTIVYVDLKAEDLDIENLGFYINHVDRLCNSAEVKNWTGCSQFRESISDHF